MCNYRDFETELDFDSDEDYPTLGLTYESMYFEEAMDRIERVQDMRSELYPLIDLLEQLK